MGRFETTRWSVVLRARGEATDARAALETLCRTYRPPVLAYVRRNVHAQDNAEDLVQAFFTRFLEHGWHASADPDRGRFRSFLLVALKRFLINANAEASALKRGGGFRFEALDEEITSAASSGNTPEQEFDRAWAKAVLGAAYARLRAEAEQAGKLPMFERLSEFLAETPNAADYSRVAEELDMRRNTLAVAVHRLRHRLRELVQDELADTIASRDDMDAELRALRGALGSSLGQDRSTLDV